MAEQNQGDRISRIYAKAIEHGVIDQNEVSEDRFRSSMQNESDLNSFYDAGMAAGMQFSSRDEFSKLMAHPELDRQSALNYQEPASAPAADSAPAPTEQPKRSFGQRAMDFIRSIGENNSTAGMVGQAHAAAQPIINQANADEAEAKRLKEAALPVSQEDDAREAAILEVSQRIARDKAAGIDVAKDERALAELQAQRPTYMQGEDMNPTDVAMRYINAWSNNTEEGRARAQQLKDDVQATVFNYRDEFEQTNEFKQVLSDARSGKISQQDAEAKLDKMFQAMYGDRIKQETGSLMQSFHQDAMAADNGYIKREQQKMMEHQVGQLIDEGMAQISASNRKKMDDFNQAVGNGFGSAQAKSAYMQSINQTGYEGAARQLYYEAMNALTDPHKGEGKWGSLSASFLRHTLEKADNLISFGVSDMNVAGAQAEVLNKIADNNAYDHPELVLEDDEMALYNAIIAKTAVEMLRADNTSWLASAGKQTADMLPFVRDIMIGQGIIGGLTEAGKKGIIRGVARTIGNGKWGKLLANVGATTMGAAESAVISSFLPSTFQHMFENSANIDAGALNFDNPLGGITLNNGGINQQGMGASYVQAWADQTKELFTETGGNTQLFMRAFRESPIGRRLGASTIGTLMNDFSKTGVGEFLNNAAYHGFVEEIGEEFEGTFYDACGAAIDAYKNGGSAAEAFGDTYGEFLNPDTFVPMLISFAIPSVLGTAGSLTQAANTQRKYQKAYAQLQDVLRTSGMTDDAAEQFITDFRGAMYSGSIDDIQQAISSSAMIVAEGDENKAMAVAAALSQYAVSDANLGAIQQKHAGEQSKVKEMYRAQEAIEEEVAGQTNQTDGNVYHVGHEGQEGYVSNGSVGEVYTNADGDSKFVGNGVVTVKMDNGEVVQVGEQELRPLEEPVPTDQLIQQREQQAEQTIQLSDTFRPGSMVEMLGQDGNPSGQTSRVVGVSDQGVEVEIEGPDGQITTTIIPAGQAMQLLHPLRIDAQVLEEVTLNINGREESFVSMGGGMFAAKDGSGSVTEDELTYLLTQGATIVNRQTVDAKDAEEEAVQEAIDNQPTPAQEFQAKYGDQSAAKVQNTISAINADLAKAQEAYKQVAAEYDKLPDAYDEVTQRQEAEVAERLQATKQEVDRLTDMLNRYNAIAEEIGAQQMSPAEHIQERQEEIDNNMFAFDTTTEEGMRGMAAFRAWTNAMRDKKVINRLISLNKKNKTNDYFVVLDNDGNVRAIATSADEAYADAEKANLQEFDAVRDKADRAGRNRKIYVAHVNVAMDNAAQQMRIALGAMTDADKVALAEAQTDTNPTEAQKEAGNYKKGHVRVQGFDITIENPKGSVRRGTDANGKEWQIEMQNTYGYFLGTEGVDGDHIDVFLGDNLDSDKIYVVDQVNPAEGTFDEHKVMMGFNSMEEAQQAYLSNYEEGWQGLGTISEVSLDEFHKWIESSHRKTKPFAEYKSVEITASEGGAKDVEREVALLAMTFGVPVHAAHSIDEVHDEQAREALQKGQKAVGWYSPNGEVEIFVPNCATAQLARETFFHEVVAHKGLRQVLGKENFNKVCQRVWKGMSDADKMEMMQYTASTLSKAVSTRLLGHEYDGSVTDFMSLMNNAEAQRFAADEYMAHVAEQYANLDANDNSTLAQRIRQQFEEIVEAIKQFVDELLGSDSMLTKDDVLKLLQMSQANLMAEAAGKDVKETADAVAEGADVMPVDIIDENTNFNIITYGHTDDGYFTDEQGNRHKGTRLMILEELEKQNMPKEQVDSFIGAMDYWYDFCSELSSFVDEDGSFKFEAFHEWNEKKPKYKEIGGRVEKALSSLVNNGEYPINVELSTDCIKREALTDLYDAIASRGGNSFAAMGPKEIEDIKKLMQNYGIQVACPLCFVEGKRLGIYNWAQTIVDDWNRALVVATGTKMDFEEYKRPDNNGKKKDALHVKNIKALTKKFGAFGFYTGNGVDDVVQSTPFKGTSHDAQEREQQKIINKVYNYLTDRSRMRPVDLFESEEVAKLYEDTLLGFENAYMQEHPTGTFTPKKLTEEQRAELEAISTAHDNSVFGKMVEAIRKYPELQHTLDLNDLIGSSGITAIRESNGEAAEALYSLILQRFGTATPKVVQKAEPYAGEILSLSKSDFDKANAIGGARMFSFSDFDLTKVFDIMQIIFDCSAKNVKLQSYSKEIPYILLFGQTGAKINMSMLPLVEVSKEVADRYNKASQDGKAAIKHEVAENGGLVMEGNHIAGFQWSDSHSIRPEFAQWIYRNDKYNANCGAIVVGVSVNHALKACMTDYIRQVIPFHLSGMPIASRNASDVGWYRDFTSTRNTTVGKDGKFASIGGKTTKDAYGAFEDFPFYDGDQNEDGTPNLDWDMRTRCAEYVAWCEKGIESKKGEHLDVRPRFYWGVNADAYMDWCYENGYKPNAEIVRGMEENSTVYTIDGKQYKIFDGYYKMICDFNTYKPVFKEDGSLDHEERAPHGAVTNNLVTDKETLDLVFGAGDSMLNNRETSMEHNAKYGQEMAKHVITYLNSKRTKKDVEKMLNHGTGERFENEADSELFMRRQETKKEMAQRIKLENEVAESEDQTQFKVLDENNAEDKALIDKFDAEIASGDYEEVYRAMILDENGNLAAPMSSKGVGSAKVDKKGKRAAGSVANSVKIAGGLLNKYEAAEEHPEIALLQEGAKHGYVTIRDDAGGSTTVAYNPYLHTSMQMLNDQFSKAWRRPNMVVVRCLVPKSELESGYKAEYAKDGVGMVSWTDGPVSQKFPKGKERVVALTRYAKPVEIISGENQPEKYAESVKQLLADRDMADFALPFNTLAPWQAEALYKAGVKIGEPAAYGGGRNEKSMAAWEEWKKTHPTTPDGEGTREKEQKNSPQDMDTIPMWAEQSDRVINDKKSLKHDVQNVISDIDAAKLRKKAETAKYLDDKSEKNSESTQFKIAFHGSAANFDHFDRSFAGTGEGQSVMGNGVYVAEGKGAAEYYATTAQQMRRHVVQPGGVYVDGELANNREAYDAYSLIEKEGSVEAAIAKCEDFLEKHKDKEGKPGLMGKTISYDHIRRRIKWLQDHKDSTIEMRDEVVDMPNRYLYKVDIPENNGRNYLNWDGRVLGTKVVKARRALNEELMKQDKEFWTKNMDIVDDAWNSVLSNPMGGILYDTMRQFMDGDRVSEIMHDLGFVGIVGDASHDSKNYVIFDPADAKIVEKTQFKVANANQEVFVSNASQAVAKVKQDKATPQQWLAMITKEGGLKAGEDKWMGLSDWLKSSNAKSLTKEEVMNFVRENAIKIYEEKYEENPIIQEVLDSYQSRFNEYVDVAAEEMGEGSSYPDWYERAYEMLVDDEGDDFRDALTYDEYTGELEPVMDMYGDNMTPQAEYYLISGNVKPINATRLGYTTQGLANKREIALVVPTIESWNEDDKIHFGDAMDGRAIGWIRFGETTAEGTKWKEYRELQDKLRAKYPRINFEGDLAELTDEEYAEYKRLSRSLNDLDRVLVIDEIQSNRHQEGREKGYLKFTRTDVGRLRKKESEYLNDLRKKYPLGEYDIDEDKMSEDEREKLDQLHKEYVEAFNYVNYEAQGAVPDAPFDKNWMELCFKRMLRLAAEEGYDRVAWTSGKQQADRYGLGGVVDEITVSNEGYDYNLQEWDEVKLRSVNILLQNENRIKFDINGEGQIISSVAGQYDGKTLADVVGKEMAVKILSVNDEDYETTFRGGDLEVGGEGMKSFYDQMLPSFVKKYTKKWGATVEDVTLPNVEEAGRVMHSVNITPEMKESVMEGQTMFKAIGETGAAALDKAEEGNYRLNNLETARSMEEAKKDARVIKSATGWERGADGKWRYEMMDGKWNDEVPLRELQVGTPFSRIVYLPEVWDDKELFKAYPQLKECTVSAEWLSPGTYGEFSESMQNITLSIRYFDFKSDDTKMRRTIVHEIQHAIQHIEGFAQGGSSSSTYAELADLDKKIEPMLKDLWDKYPKLNLFTTTPEWSTFDALPGNLKHVIEYYKKYKDALPILGKLTTDQVSSLLAMKQNLDTTTDVVIAEAEKMGLSREEAWDAVWAIPYYPYTRDNVLPRTAEEVDALVADFKKVIKEVNDFKKPIKQFFKLQNVRPSEKVGMEGYYKLAGEVEARNISARLGMNMQERREMLLETTEDVSRKDQKFIMDSMDAASIAKSLKVDGAEQTRFKTAVTPDMDAEYEKAVEKGDEKTIKKLLVEAAKIAIPNTKVVDKKGNPRLVYHGTPKKQFYKFKDGASFFTSKESNAMEYTAVRGSLSISHSNEGHVVPVFLNIENPLVIDVHGSWRNINKHAVERIIGKPIEDIEGLRIDTERVVKIAKENGYDGVIFKNLSDHVWDNFHDQADVYVTFNPSQIKGVGTEYETKDQNHFPWGKEVRIKRTFGATYDDEGNLIPLSQRFDKENDDTRFRVLDDADEDTRDFIDLEQSGSIDPKALEIEEQWQTTMDRLTAMNMQKEAELAKNKAGVREDVEYLKRNISSARATTDMVYRQMNRLTDAMRTQADFWRASRNEVTNLAKMMVRYGWADGVSRRDLAKLLTELAKTNTNDMISMQRHLDDMVVLMGEIAVKHEHDLFAKQCKVSAKDVKLNSAGVEVMGNMGIRGKEVMRTFNELAAKRHLPSIEKLDSKILEEYDLANKATNSDERLIHEGRADGYQYAKEYAEGVAALEEEKQDLIQDLNDALIDERLNPAAKRERRHELQKAIMKTNFELMNAYRDLTAKMGSVIAVYKQDSKDWAAAQREHIQEIYHYANSDLEGLPDNPHEVETKKQVAREMANSITSPARSFESMLRMLGAKHVEGEGYLYDHFLRGWVRAAEKEQTGLEAAYKSLDEQASSIMGKKMTFADFASQLDRMPKSSVFFINGDVEQEAELSQGNLAYIYMVNKMDDGKLKLRSMNISEEQVDLIKDMLDPRVKEMCDWIQSDFLPSLRGKYNEVYMRMFGTNMTEIDDYFPLRILGAAINQQDDLAEDQVGLDRMAGTTTGSVKKRVKNSKPLDILNTNAFRTTIQHIQEMEHWAAFSELVRDANALFSYNGFKTKVKKMNTLYGKGDDLYRNLRTVFQVALGTYKPKTDAISKGLLKVAKGVTGAKINFRVFTALKQITSNPAFYPYLADPVFAQSFGNSLRPTQWKKTMEWGKENLPLLKKRINSRDLGDFVLAERADDAEWQKKVMQLMTKYGMALNGFFDALTCAQGAKAVYDSRYAKYIRQGVSEDEAVQRAKEDAEISYNKSQQSNEGAFVSEVQMDRNWMTAAWTVFRNSSMAYTRNFVVSARAINNSLGSTTQTLKEEDGKPYTVTRKNKDIQIEFMTKQLVRRGMEDTEAREEAEKEYKKGLVSNIVGVAVYGYVLNLLWRLTAAAPYLIAGDDDDKKKDLLINAFTGGAYLSPLYGFAGGQVLESICDGNAGLEDFFKPTMAISSDLTTATRQLKNNQYAEFANSIMNVIMQSTVGFNPETLTSVVTAVIANHDSEKGLTGQEMMMDVAAILSIPKSSRKQFFLDQIEDRFEKSNDWSVFKQSGDYKKLRQRYVDWQLIESAPATFWMRNDEQEEKAADRYGKQFDTMCKERLELKGKQTK